MRNINFISYGPFLVHTVKTPMRREDLIAEKDTRNQISDPFRVPRGQLLAPRGAILDTFWSFQTSSGTPGVPRALQGALPDATWAPQELSGDSLELPGTFKNL